MEHVTKKYISCKKEHRANNSYKSLQVNEIIAEEGVTFFGIRKKIEDKEMRKKKRVIIKMTK